MQYSFCRLGTTLTMCDWRLPRSIEDSDRKSRPCRSLVGKIRTVPGPTAPLASPTNSLSRTRLPLSSLQSTPLGHLASVDANGLTNSLTTFRISTYAKLGGRGTPLLLPLRSVAIGSSLQYILPRRLSDEDSSPACPVPCGEQACPRQAGKQGRRSESNDFPGLVQKPFDQWSYLYTGILPRLKSLVCRSYENCRGVGVFFPFRNASSRRSNVQTFRRAADPFFPILLRLPFASSGRAIVPRPGVHSTYQIHARTRP
jgi:hypothetical protein